MTTVRVQVDPMPAMRDWLRANMPAAGWVRATLPTDWAPKGGAPGVILSDDGGPAEYPVRTIHTVRITAWGADKTTVRDLAAEAAGRLVAGRPPGIAHTSKRAGAVLDARDQATGACLASVLITTQARMKEL
ncbi:hypothetical protein HWD35_20890 [Tsukamurella tyrosinosolvens]|uniref:hypothetical protein n=1 Tax=Tsukamurella tyrosinosolvens TaxID=57704 RepID=UPI001CE153A2|nr:hypothetical protein [Tsukamurella tyrosinosolvens]MCA4997183.1 hypothetical protein [Tsukamurella tyrosinosolvens]